MTDREELDVHWIRGDTLFFLGNAQKLLDRRKSTKAFPNPWDVGLNYLEGERARRPGSRTFNECMPLLNFYRTTGTVFEHMRETTEEDIVLMLHNAGEETELLTY